MGWEGAEERSDALPCCFYGSLGGFSQEQLELGEDLFDWIEVRGVGRQEQQPGPSRADRLADGCALVTAKVVHDDDIAGVERWDEELLDPGGEAEAVDRSVKDARRIDPVMTECCQEGQRAPFAERRAGDELAAARRPASDRGHVGLGPGLVDEDEAPGIKPVLILLPLLPPPGDLRPQLLDGEQRFF